MTQRERTWVPPLQEPLGLWAMPICAHLLSHPPTPAVMPGASPTLTVTRIPLEGGWGARAEEGGRAAKSVP